MSDDKIYEIPAEWKQRAFISEAKYEEMYQRSVKDPNGFWGEQAKRITYQELHDEVCRMANILRNRNVKKGDRVTIYMPMIPEAAYAMLACARIGAVYSVVFGGFSPDSLAGRIEDCQSKVIITAD